MCTYFPIQFFIWQVSWLFCFKLTRSRIHKPKHKHFLKKGNIYHLHLQAQVRIHCITNYFMHYHTSFSLSSQNYYEIQIKYELYIVQMDPATLLFLRLLGLCKCLQISKRKLKPEDKAVGYKLSQPDYSNAKFINVLLFP